MAVVGIDLGTTNTVIAAVRDGRATALKDKVGRALLPSVVSFSPKGAPKIGYPAKDRRTIDPENTIFSIKRLIGRTFDSEHVQKAIKRLPFDLKEGPGKSTLVGAYGKDHTLPEISAMVLRQAAEIAEARLGTEVFDAVITVPANFNDLQRAATKVAGRTAGLEVLRIINEPTAAALAYGFGKKGRERIAVYDFGGGTFDVTLLDLSENVFEVLATAGDTFLGGDDIDREIMDRMAEELLKKNKIDASRDNLVREQLRAAAEKLKIDLSTRSMGKVHVEDLEFDFTMRRSEFEKLTEPLLARTLQVCQEALDVAGVAKKDLDQVLLVGGSTRIPLVRRRISSFFGKMPQSRINPDEVVAIGAAIQAASLEAKQGQTNLPAAPRPRAQSLNASPSPHAYSSSSHPSRAPEGARSTGTTKTGLAGLKKTLAGPGPSDAPPRTTETSVLAGVKSVPPAVSGPGPKVGPAQTLSGVGPARTSSPPVQLGAIRKTDPTGTGREKMNTLAGVGGETPERRRSNTLSGLNERPKATTNLGLGTSPSSPPPKGHLAATLPLGSASPLKKTSPASSTDKDATGLDFDDITSVQESPDLEAAARDKLETIPGAAAPPNDGAMFPSAASDSRQGSSIPPASNDGSVTFDLADLEASEEEITHEFSDLNEEKTQLVDPKIVAANAAVLEQSSRSGRSAGQPSAKSFSDDSGHDFGSGHDFESVDLPSPSTRGPNPLSRGKAHQIEELGDSALMTMEEMGLDHDTEVDLPAPLSDLPAPVSRKPAELGASALLDLDDDELSLDDDELNLDDDGVDLPTASAGLPSLSSNAGQSGGAFARTVAGLPSPLGAGLPQPAGILPQTAKAGLPQTAGILPEASAGLPRPADLIDDHDDEFNLPLVGSDTDTSGLEDKTSSNTGGTPNFEAARQASPSPSVHDLDELSVSALLPEDESGAYPLNLDATGVIGLGGPSADESKGQKPAPAHQSSSLGSDADALSPEPARAFSTQQVRAPQPSSDSIPEPGVPVPGIGGTPLLLDVTPLSLGVEVVGGYVDRLIERNSPVPCERTRTFATAQDNQSMVRVRVSQGEDGHFERNTVLGEVELTGISQGPRGSVKVDVSFSLDESGMLQVSARDQATGHAANARLMLAGVAPG